MRLWNYHEYSSTETLVKEGCNERGMNVELSEVEGETSNSRAGPRCKEPVEIGSIHFGFDVKNDGNYAES